MFRCSNILKREKTRCKKVKDVDVVINTITATSKLSLLNFAFYFFVLILFCNVHKITNFISDFFVCKNLII